MAGVQDILDTLGQIVGGNEDGVTVVHAVLIV